MKNDEPEKSDDLLTEAARKMIDDNKDELRNHMEWMRQMDDQRRRQDARAERESIGVALALAIEDLATVHALRAEFPDHAHNDFHPSPERLMAILGADRGAEVANLSGEAQDAESALWVARGLMGALEEMLDRKRTAATLCLHGS